MAIEGNEDLSQLSDDELDARQRAVDGEDPKTDPIVGDDDPEAKAAADAKATADAAVAAKATEDAEAAAKATEAAAAQAAGAEGAKEPAKIEGVQSKDGSRVLPYAALQAERRSARAASARAERAERDLETARQQLADFKAGKTPETPITEADVAAMEADFPEEGKKMRAAFTRIQELEKNAPKPAAQADEPGDDPIQEAIDQVPLLLKWQHEDSDKFAYAQKVDAVLLESPKWVSKPAVERFTEVARRVAGEYDIPFDTPKPSATPAAQPAATAKPAAPVAERKLPESLSDFKGGTVADHGTTDWARLSPQGQLARMADMSDDEIDAHLAKYGQ